MTTAPRPASLTPERRGMLAKAAIARKQLLLDDDAYRDVLRRTIGVSSARDASDAQLHRLLAEFSRLGFKATRPQGSGTRSDKSHARLIVALWGELAPFLRDPSAQTLRSFVQRQTKSPLHPDGVSAPEFLDGKQAIKVIEALKRWLARERDAVAKS